MHPALRVTSCSEVWHIFCLQLQAIMAFVDGQQRSLDSLSSVTDKALITKVCAHWFAKYIWTGMFQTVSLMLQYYKVSPNELKVGTLADAALFKIAARDC